MLKKTIRINLFNLRPLGLGGTFKRKDKIESAFSLKGVEEGYFETNSIG